MVVVVVELLRWFFFVEREKEREEVSSGDGDDDSKFPKHRRRIRIPTRFDSSTAVLPLIAMRQGREDRSRPRVTWGYAPRHGAKAGKRRESVKKISAP